jgi:hypothetical protein
VLDSLHRSLQERQLTRPFYLVASCGLHNLQLSIANPIKTTMGDGGLDKRTVMQLLHSVYDLQESVDHELLKMHVTEALQFLQADRITPFVGDGDEADEQFAAKWTLVKSFRLFQDITDKDILRATLKIPAPVLTRWWTVGETARVVWGSYLLLFRICQQIINTSLTSSKHNKIASGLQPLMMEPELFSDLAFINCYHTFYVCPHFAWMQEATDLSGIPGFQAHNTLGRYFLIIQDLTQSATTATTTHPQFVDFQLTLDISPGLRSQQVLKASKFISISIDNVNKHFVRWCQPSLLPAALLSEDPLSKTVAAVMLKVPLLPVIAPQDFQSAAHHDRTFNIPAFYSFIHSKIDGDYNGYHPLVAFAAEEILKGSLNLRDMDNDDNRGDKDFFYSNFLPLASQTQFVEAGVKEAKNVSPTDRSEQLRSAYAVIRAARVHSVDSLGIIKSTKRIEGLLESAIHHYGVHETFRVDHPDYDERIQLISNAMRKDHFKVDRVLKLQQDALYKVHKNKKQNQLQKKTGVDRTHTMQGLFPYGKLVKKLHFDALKEELQFRGCTDEELHGLPITQLKTKLKELELARVDNDEEDATAKAAANKAFKPLSGVHFQPN